MIETEKIEPERTLFWFAFVCRGTLEDYEKIKHAILKTGCGLLNSVREALLNGHH